MKLELKRRDKIALGIFVIFYVCFGIYLAQNQESLVYQPFAQDFNSCEQLSFAQKIELNGTRMYAYNTDKPVVVLYHGNAGSACGRWFYTQIFDQAGLGFILVEYTGYSNDSVKPSHWAIKKDVENVISYVEEENIELSVVVGESIGTGPASLHTAKQIPNKLILISPFTNLKELAREHFWFYPTRLAVENAYNNEEALNLYSKPILIIHGNQDKVVPHKLGEKLFVSLPSEQKTMVTIEGAGHNDLFQFEETYKALQTFLLGN